jgi:hypothetical protein
MSTIVRTGLVTFCFLFSTVALLPQSFAEEYYTYKDPCGRLVISNKTPPPGSTILKKYELPEAHPTKTQPPDEATGSQPPAASPESQHQVNSE